MNTIYVYQTSTIYKTVLELITIVEQKLNELRPEPINSNNILLKNITYRQLLSTVDTLKDLKNVLKNSKPIPDIKNGILLDAINNINIIVNEISINQTKPNTKLDDFLKILENEMTLLLIEKKEIFNSSSFYDKRIKQLQQERNDLRIKINEIEKEISSKSGQKKEEFNTKKEELIELQERLRETDRLLNQYQVEEIKREKTNDLKVEWNEKIINSFRQLKKYYQPIKEEHTRLNSLYKYYSGISFAIFIIIIIVESIICYRIANIDKALTGVDYLPLIVPIPVALGGLWGAVTLMHKVQRQMVVLAKFIYEIEYVEGLLLTMNDLSTNFNESTNKVNAAIEKLIENHLVYDGRILSGELSLEKEEKKDTMPYEEVIKLIKGVTGIVNGK